MLLLHNYDGKDLFLVVLNAVLWESKVTNLRLIIGEMIVNKLDERGDFFLSRFSKLLWRGISIRDTNNYT